MCVCVSIIPVKVVDGVAPVVLDVPTETGETHPNVQPRHLTHNTNNNSHSQTLHMQ